MLQRPTRKGKTVNPYPDRSWRRRPPLLPVAAAWRPAQEYPPVANFPQSILLPLRSRHSGRRCFNTSLAQSDQRPKWLDSEGSGIRCLRNSRMAVIKRCFHRPVVVDVIFRGQLHQLSTAAKIISICGGNCPCRLCSRSARKHSRKALCNVVLACVCHREDKGSYPTRNNRWCASGGSRHRTRAPGRDAR